MRVLSVLVLVVVVLTGCSSVQEAQDTADGVRQTAGKVRDCAELAGDLRSLLPDRAPTRAEVEQNVADARERVNSIDSADVRKAADTVLARAEDYARALATGDTAGIQRAYDRVQTSVTDAAQTCGVPIEQFTSGG